MEHILQVNLEDSGGAFSLMFQVQKKLNGLAAFDYYTMSNFKSEQIVDEIKKMGGEIHCADLRANRLIGHFLLPFNFYSFLKHNHYRVIHIHSDTAWKICLYAIPARLAKISKIVIHSHSSAINGDYQGLKKMLHYIMRFFIPYVGTNFCSCSQIATEWMFRRKIRTNIIWIKNGVDTGKFQYSESNRKEIRKNLDLDEYTALIGMVGDLSFQKNPEYILKVFKELIKSAQTGRRYKLIFIGSGENDDAIKKLTNDYKLVDSTIFFGKTNEVYKVLSALDLYVMPSRAEGLPVSAIEAQANGLPCILSSRITSEVALCENTLFEDISDSMLEQWVIDIQQLLDKDVDRSAGRQITLEKGFDISQTTNELYKVYNA